MSALTSSLVCDVKRHFRFPGNSDECLALVMQYCYWFVFSEAVLGVDKCFLQ